jgi:hypothetical protein
MNTEPNCCGFSQGPPCLAIHRMTTIGGEDDTRSWFARKHGAWLADKWCNDGFAQRAAA